MADLSITPANVKLRFGSGVSVFTANGAIAQGDVFTAHPTSGYARADANLANYQSIQGIAMTPAADGEQFVGHIRPGEIIDIGATGLTPGVVYYLSNNAGKICPFADLTTGSRPVLVGSAETSTTFRTIYTALATDL
jgi:hypothetical protein